MSTKDWKTRGDLLIVLGVITMFSGGAASRQGPETLLAGATISALGWALAIWGATDYVTWKGYSTWLGFMAYLLLPGLIILACLPNRRKRLNASLLALPAEGTSPEAAVSPFRYLIALVPLGLLYAGFVGFLMTTRAGVARSDWQTLTPVNHSFIVEMPGLVREAHAVQETPSGSVTTHKFSVMPKGKKELYMVLVFRFPEQVRKNIGGTQQLLELGKQDVITAVNGQLRSQKQISLSGIPGLDVEVLPAKGAIVRSHIYATENSLYQVSVHVPQIRLKSADVERFLNSFQIKLQPAD